jgi:hypothetical protein
MLRRFHADPCATATPIANRLEASVDLGKLAVEGLGIQARNLGGNSELFEHLIGQAVRERTRELAPTQDATIQAPTTLVERREIATALADPEDAARRRGA